MAVDEFDSIITGSRLEGARGVVDGPDGCSGRLYGHEIFMSKSLRSGSNFCLFHR